MDDGGGKIREEQLWREWHEMCLPCAIMGLQWLKDSDMQPV